MKKVIYLSFICISMNGFAQIEQIEVKQVNKGAQILGYDSTEFISHEMFNGVFQEADINMIKRFIGQEVVVLPKSHKCPQNNESAFMGYSYFLNSPKSAANIENGLYKPVKAGRMGSGYNYVSDYKALAGKKFKIDDVVEYGHRQGFFYKMVNVVNGDEVYFNVRGDGGNSRTNLYNIYPPLLVVGYYEKLKKLYISKDFLFINKDNKTNTLIDNNTGQPIEANPQAEWNCTKLAVADYTDRPYQTVTVLLTNTAGNLIAVELYNFQRNFMEKSQFLAQEEKRKAAQDVLTQKKAEQEQHKKEMAQKVAEERLQRKKEDNEKLKLRIEALTNKYGAEIATLIVNRKVRIGMTKAMCVEAWDNPYDISKQISANSVTEVWTYDIVTFLYFNEKGILVTIQD